MPTIKQFNLQAEETGEVTLSDAVFAAPIHVPAMHQVVVAQLANRRQGTSACKTRSEVRGGGRKPYRQKHTGRARAGSTRSPLWIGGGVIHGPKPRDYAKKVNRKVRRLALRSALSLKVREESLVVVDYTGFETPKTRTMVDLFKKLDVARKPLVILHETHEAVSRSTRNIPGAKVLHVDSINVYDVLNSENLILSSGAVAKLEEVYGR